MNLTYVSGTDAQRALVAQSLGLIAYPLDDRVDMEISVGFDDDPCAGLHNEFACTTVPATPRDECDRPFSAAVVFKNGLEVLTPGNQFSGEVFFQETVAHEFGHVVAAHLLDEQITQVCQLFGGTRAQWHTDTGAWETLIQEAFAETFKDVYLPRADRLYDNRTNWRLPRASYDAWLDIIDTLCPCFTGGVS